MQEEWDEKSDPVNLRLMKEKVDLLWPVPKLKHHVILLFRVHCRVPCYTRHSLCLAWARSASMLWECRLDMAGTLR